MIFFWRGIIFALALWGLNVTAGTAPKGSSALSMYGVPKYEDDFFAFEYVNPNAPKGGVLKQAAFGSFDTFNPFVIGGIAPGGVALMHDTLMKQSDDEAFSLYGLIADRVQLNSEAHTVSFHINPNARFSDGSKITPQDVVFSFNILKEKGLPVFRYYYGDVRRVTVQGEWVVFYLNPSAPNRELPLILGELPVLSEAYWSTRDFDKTSLDIPVSSGPYTVESFEPGRFIVYVRRTDYWAHDLNVNRGYYNFDKIRYDYYRDAAVALEAFKAGLIDLRLETEAKKWILFREFPAVSDGRIQMRTFAHHLPSGMQGFVFNLRRPVFRDVRVRQALSYVFDFEWTNKNLFYGLYQRTNSYFDNSSLKAPPLPDAAEQALLAPYRDMLPAKMWTQPFVANPYEGQPLRIRLKAALDLLDEAGWHVKNGRLENAQGEALRFEILLDAASVGSWERVTLPYVGLLRQLGVDVSLRVVDLIHYKNRLDQFDYDMIVAVWGQSLSPGNEQRYFWGSAAAQTPGSLNYAGIADPVVDALIEHVIGARDQAALETAVHALDRVLLASHLVVPHWFSPVQRYIFWNKFGFPENVPLKGTNPLYWWFLPEKQT